MNKDTIKIKLENVQLHNRINQIREKNDRTKKEVFNLINKYEYSVENYKKEIEKIKQENEILKYEFHSLRVKYDKIPKIIRRIFEKGEKNINE